MSKTDEQLYNELVEAAARIVAFHGISDAPTPEVAHTLASEAIDLRNGWKDFDENGEPGVQPLPVVDAVADEVFARADELRKAFAAKLAAAATLRERPAGTRH